jgi:hypothetical protein
VISARAGVTVARRLGLLGVILAAPACGAESRGHVLWDLDAALPPAATMDAAPIDAGCTDCVSPVGFADDVLTAKHGGSTGDPHTDTCPEHQAVIGFKGFLTEGDAGLVLIGAIQAVCGELAQRGTSSTLSTAPGATQPLRGLERGAAWSQMCPADQVVVGFSGHSGAALDQIAFACAPWSVTRTPSGVAFSRPAATLLTAAGGDGGNAFQEECPTGQMARGQDLRSGQWVDAFGLVCATPEL